MAVFPLATGEHRGGIGICHAADQSVICSMESRLSNFSKTRRDGERLNICHFAPDLLSCKDRILVGAPKSQMSTVEAQSLSGSTLLVLTVS